MYLRQQLEPISSTSTPTEFEVLPGWGARRVAEELKKANLIRNATLFSAYLRYYELDRKLGEGLYDLDPAMHSAEIAEALAQGGRPRTVRVLIPEGLRGRDIVQRLVEAGLSSEPVLLGLMDHPGSLKPDYIPEGQTLEGYLFPASYDIPLKSSAEDIVRLFLERFEQELTADIQAQLSAKGYSIHGWVTLASMIQSEAGSAQEMPIIAGVFLNRLDDGMLLQSDPTVAYGLGKNLPELDAVAGDLQKDHPWNTYLHAGLPPGPISNPGTDALHAVLQPERQNAAGQSYFYFLHGNDNGQLVFRPNISLQDHNRDVQLYLR
jgi:UPF0755 protein